MEFQLFRKKVRIFGIVKQLLSLCEVIQDIKVNQSLITEVER